MKRRNFLGLVAVTAAAPLVPTVAKEPDKTLWPKGGFLIRDHWKETITNRELCEKFDYGLDFNQEVERMRFEHSIMPVGVYAKEALAEQVLLCDNLQENYLPSYEGPSRWLYATPHEWTPEEVERHGTSSSFSPEFVSTDMFFAQSESDCVKLPWIVKDDVHIKNMMLMHLLKSASRLMPIHGYGVVAGKARMVKNFKELDLACDLQKRSGLTPKQLVTNYIPLTNGDMDPIEQRLGHKLNVFLCYECPKNLAFLLAEPEEVGVYVQRLKWKLDCVSVEPRRYSSQMVLKPMPDWAMGIHYQTDAVIPIEV